MEQEPSLIQVQQPTPSSAASIQERRLSVLMPAFNEGANIYRNARLTESVIAEFYGDFEIVVINDGSSDQTLVEATRAAAESARIHVVDCPVNVGKGQALAEGLKRANGDLIVFLDADLDLHPSQIADFLSRMEKSGADIVIGSKMHPESKLYYPARRKFLSRGYFTLVRLLFWLPINDTQTGLKLFKGDALRRIFPKMLVKKFGYDLEMLVLAHHWGYRIAEAPIELNFGRETRIGRIKFEDIRRLFIDTLAIFYRLRILKYYER